MEFLSCSGNCQLLWMVMKSRSPAKEYALFIVWASERGGRRRWGWTLHAERKEVEDSPVVAAVERWVLRWLDSFLPWLLEPFHGLLLVRWVFYSRAEQHPPRWLPRHRNLILSAVTLGPLVTFRLTVFDFMCKNTVVRPVLLLKTFIKCDMLLWRYRKFSAVYTLSSQNYFFMKTNTQMQIICVIVSFLMCDGGEKNLLVSKIENIETIFILFMTATPTATLDNKPVHLDSYSTENACIWYDSDIQHVDKFTVTGNLTSATRGNRCTSAI